MYVQVLVCIYIYIYILTTYTYVYGNQRTYTYRNIPKPIWKTGLDLHRGSATRLCIEFFFYEWWRHWTLLATSTHSRDPSGSGWREWPLDERTTHHLGVRSMMDIKKPDRLFHGIANCKNVCPKVVDTVSLNTWKYMWPGIMYACNWWKGKLIRNHWVW